MSGSDNLIRRAPRRTRWLAYVALLSIAAVWGGTFFMVKGATANFPVLAFLALRFTLASLVLLPLVLRTRHKPTRRELAWGSLAGVTFFLGYTFQTFAMRLVFSGRVGFITGLYVVLVPILAWIFLRHTPTPRVIAGAVFALVGLTLLSYAPGGDLVGDLLAFLGALSFAAQILIVEKFPRDSDWRVASLLQAGWVAVSSLILLPIQAAVHACSLPICAVFGPITESLPTAVSVDVWVTVILVAAFTGVVATAVGLALQIWGQKQLPPSDAALIFATESPFSALFGWLILGEGMTVGALVGCGLIMAGMLTTTLSAPQGTQRRTIRSSMRGWSSQFSLSRLRDRAFMLKQPEAVEVEVEEIG